jgi:GTP-binding protein
MSFMRSVCNVSGVAVRVSKEPGCTKNINYFAFCKKNGTPATYFIDLPGYGYAKKSKEERSKWDNLIREYLVARDISVLRYGYPRQCHVVNEVFTVCRRVYILIDGRRGPMEADGNMMELLTKAALTHQVWPFTFCFLVII